MDGVDGVDGVDGGGEMNSAIHLYGRVSDGGRYERDLTRWLPDWQDTSRAIGGFWTGQGTLSGMTRGALSDLFQNALGRTLRRLAYGTIAWEGYVYELRLRLAGAEYIRSLTPERFSNRIQAAYTTDNGKKKKTPWSENTDSISMYGRMDYVHTAGTVAEWSVAKLVERRLGEFGWPRSYMAGMGGMATPMRRNSDADSLVISAAGYWSTLNWRYYDIPELGELKECSLTVEKALGQSEFVSAGRIETNGDMFTQTAGDPPQRLGDVLEGVIQQGGYDGKPWRGGVWANRQFVYEAAPTAVTHLWRSGQLRAVGGGPAVLDVVKPGFLMRNSDAPPGSLPPGATDIWDDPRVAYVDEVTWQSPGTVTLGVLEPNVGPTEAQLARNERITNAEQARIQQALADFQAAWENDYRKREREYVRLEHWQEYIEMTGHPWSGRYDS